MSFSVSKVRLREDFHQARDALRSVTPGDRYWLLAAAMLHSLAEDLRFAFRAGRWVESPDEMARDVAWVPTGTSEKPRLLPAELAREYRSARVDDLLALIRQETGGAVRWNRSDIIRMAKGGAVVA